MYGIDRKSQLGYVLNLYIGSVMNILQLFRPAAFASQIEGDEAIGKAYRYWRGRVFSGIYIGYIFFLFTRRSMTFVFPALMADTGFTMSQVGILGSILSVMYGISKFLSGMIADRSNPRFFMAIGLICTGVAALFFSLSSSLLLFAFFTAINGFFQGWGWPPCARQLTHWFSQRERGTWWGLWNTATSLGVAATALLAGSIATHFGWRAAVFIPSLLAIGGGFLIMTLMRDTPQSVGLPPIEVFKKEAASLPKERELSVKEILFKYVLTNRYLWNLAFAYFCIYLIREAITCWGLLYLIQTKGSSFGVASTCIVFFEMGGFCGSLAAGWISDTFFKGKRGPVTILFTLGILLPMTYFCLSPTVPPFVDFAFFCLSGFLVYGPQMVIGMHAAELAHKKASATASGFTGTFAYAGAAVAGYPLTLVTQHFGWQVFFIALICAAAAAALLLAPLWSVQRRPEPVVAT